MPFLLRLPLKQPELRAAHHRHRKRKLAKLARVQGHRGGHVPTLPELKLDASDVVAMEDVPVDFTMAAAAKAAAEEAAARAAAEEEAVEEQRSLDPKRPNDAGMAAMAGAKAPVTASDIAQKKGRQHRKTATW